MADYTRVFPRIDACQIETLKTAIKTYGVNPQLDMVIEEMSELTKAILKMRRTVNSGKGFESQYHDLCEEAADVFVMLAQLVIMYNCLDQVQDVFDYKILRLENRIGKD